MLLTLSFLCLTFTYSAGYQTCLSCRGTVQPRNCETITRCGYGESCYTEAVITTLGFVRYNLGCRDNQQCSASPPIIRRSPDDGMTICSECCAGELCNNNGCGTDGYPSSTKRGPLCYSCHEHARTDDCNQISLCGANQICELRSKFSHVTTDQLYTSGCTNFMGACTITAAYRTAGTCNHCCMGDLCNNKCSQTTPAPSLSSTQNPIITTSSATTNPMATSSATNYPNTTSSAITNQNTTSSAISNQNTTSSAISNPNTTSSAITNQNTTSSAISNQNTTSSAISNPNTTSSAISNPNTTSSAITNPNTTSSAITNLNTMTSSNTGTQTTTSSSTSTASSTHTTTPSTHAPHRHCKRPSDCKRLPDGDYQSCSGCNYYLTCSSTGHFDRNCPPYEEYDSKLKICTHHSTTCH